MLKELLGVRGADLERIAGAMFKWLFEGCSYRTMQYTLAKHYEDAELMASELSALTKTNGYILRNCKLYAYAVYCARRDGDKLPSPASYEVASEDAKLLRALDLSHLALLDCFESMTLQTFDALVLDSITANKSYMAKFIYRKLRFLIQSYNVTEADLYALFNEATVYSIQRRYPNFSTPMHALNIAKRAIHNRGQFAITYNTHPDRDRLINDGGGLFSSVLSPITDAVQISSDGPSMREELLSVLAELEAGMSEPVRRYMLIMMGEYDAGFSHYLGEDNSEAVDYLAYGKYRRHVEKYLGLTRSATENLFAKLREHSGV